jgi:hypothetical protein
VESPGRATVAVAAAIEAEDSAMAAGAVEMAPEYAGVLRATARLVEDKETGTETLPVESVAATGVEETAVAGAVEVWTGALVTAVFEGEGVPLSGAAGGKSPDQDGPLPPMAGDPQIPTRNVAMKSLFTPREYTKSKTGALIRAY